jgi:hypothetical protein
VAGWPAAAGVLGLGWAACKVGKAGQAGPTGWISAQDLISNKKKKIQIYFINYKSI